MNPARGSRSWKWRSYPGAVLSVVALALLYRVSLVWLGGQYYWPDEVRYAQARVAADMLLDGQWLAGWRELARPDHPMFRVLMLPPAMFESMVKASARIPALYLAVLTALNPILLRSAARALGADEARASIAAILYALLASSHYYVRHLLPYDLALGIALAALAVGLRTPVGSRRSYATGALLGASVFTYSGYWAFAAAVGLLHCVHEGVPLPVATRRALFVLSGAATVVMATVLMARYVGVDLVAGGLDFQATVVQGDFSEGWRLPWAYLWQVEHGVLALLLASILVLGLRAWRGSLDRASAMACLGGVAVYALLVLPSNGVRHFVVYGRLAKQLTPFLALVAAYPVAWVGCRAASMGMLAPAIVLLALASAYNWLGPMRQVFPDRFHRMAHELVSRNPQARFVSDRHPIPGDSAAMPAADCAVLMDSSHPLLYVPYLYEGYDPDQRAGFVARPPRQMLVLCPGVDVR